jgi:hypothetical protein
MGGLYSLPIAERKKSLAAIDLLSDDVIGLRIKPPRIPTNEEKEIASKLKEQQEQLSTSTISTQESSDALTQTVRRVEDWNTYVHIQTDFDNYSFCQLKHYSAGILLPSFVAAVGTYHVLKRTGKFRATPLVITSAASVVFWHKFMSLVYVPPCERNLMLGENPLSYRARHHLRHIAVDHDYLQEFARLQRLKEEQELYNKTVLSSTPSSVSHTTPSQTLSRS